MAPLMLFQVLPLSVLNCHCTVAAGTAVPLVVNVAVLPAFTVASAGWVSTLGASFHCNETWSRKIVLSPPLGLLETNFSVWLPAWVSVNGFDRNETNELLVAVVYVPRLMSSIKTLMLLVLSVPLLRCSSAKFTTPSEPAGMIIVWLRAADA